MPRQTYRHHWQSQNRCCGMQPGLFQNLFGSGNVVRVAIKSFCVDTDHLAALLLNALIQCVKVVHLVHRACSR